MKINNLKNCIGAYRVSGDWEDQFEADRITILRNLTFSIVTEGACPELEMAVTWCLDNIGQRSSEIGENCNYRRLGEISRKQPGNSWNELWYGKTEYDYGFSEFFFENESDLNAFELQVSNFYSIGEDGKKWKTNGFENEMQIE